MADQPQKPAQPQQPQPVQQPHPAQQPLPRPATLPAGPDPKKTGTEFNPDEGPGNPQPVRKNTTTPSPEEVESAQKKHGFASRESTTRETTKEKHVKDRDKD